MHLPKPLLITPKNADAIVAALAAVNGRAEAHAFTRVGEIARLASDAEEKVIALVGAKAHAPGAVYVATSGSKVANRYDYKRQATRVSIERRAAGWFLTEVTAVEIHQQGGGAPRLTLTQAQDARAHEVLRRQYSVAVPAAVAEVA